MRPTRRFALLAALALLAVSCGEEGGDMCANCPGPVSTVFEGIIAGNDGVETGTIDLTIDDQGGGEGTFKIGNNTITLTSVSTSGNQVTASGGGYTFTGTVNGIFIDGSYTGGAAGGLLAAAELSTGTTLTRFCATHDAGGGIAGIFAFVYNSDTEAIRGAWTSGVASAFKGILSGFAGDDAGLMSGHTGTVTVLPDVQGGSVGGFYALDSGENGSMTGPVCP